MYHAVRSWSEYKHLKTKIRQFCFFTWIPNWTFTGITILDKIISDFFFNGLHGFTNFFRQASSFFFCYFYFIFPRFLFLAVGESVGFFFRATGRRSDSPSDNQAGTFFAARAFWHQALFVSVYSALFQDIFWKITIFVCSFVRDYICNFNLYLCVIFWTNLWVLFYNFAYPFPTTGVCYPNIKPLVTHSA